MDDPLSYLFEEIQRCYCPNSEKDPSGLIKLIDKTISFPVSNNTWSCYFKSELIRDLEELSTVEGQQELCEKLKSLRFPLESLKVEKTRCVLLFNRLEIMKFVFHGILENENFGRNLKMSRPKIEVDPMLDLDLENLNNYRTKLIHSCLKNILQFINFEDSSEINMSVTGVSSKSDSLSIKCGLVVEPKTKKVCEIKSSEYLELRSTDMRLIAMHKYGMRIKDDLKFKELIQRLGNAAVSVDLLEARHTSPVQINRKGQGSTKGAAFILYNTARLDTILRGFEAGIKSGKYSNLPDLDSVDLSLLKEDDEWQLVFSYMFSFPNLIKRCVNDLYQGFFPVHTIIQYLNGLVSVFSIYYRRTRILLQNREHLMPVIHARIILLKSLQYIVIESLRIFDIEPVQYM